MGADRHPDWVHSWWLGALLMVVCVPLTLALGAALIAIAVDPGQLGGWLQAAVTLVVTALIFGPLPREHRWYLALTVLSVIVLAPIYFLFVRAISNPTIAFTSSLLTPQDVRWDGFGKAWDRGNFGPSWAPDASWSSPLTWWPQEDGALLRTMIVTVAITGLQVVTSVLAAYAFAFLRFPFKRLTFALFMATLLLPLEVTLLPNVQTMRDLGWFDTYQGLVLPFAAAAFGTFLIRQGFLGIPGEIRDAARLEGWGHLQFLWRFAVPLTRPVIASFTVISFLGAFNQYLWPRAIIIDTQNWATVQIALRGLTTSIEEFNIPVAGTIIAAVPVVILLILFQRHIIRGLTAGAVKG